MSAPDQVKRFQDRGLDVITNSPEEYVAYLRNELQKWGKLIRRGTSRRSDPEEEAAWRHAAAFPLVLPC